MRISAAVALALFMCTNAFAQAFDSTWKQLPKSFAGDNIQKLAKTLDTKKAEYESAADYKARLEKLATPGQTYVFFCAEMPFKVEYDADAQEFVFSRISYEPYITVSKFDKDGKPYIGTNAFGVSKKIRKLEVREYQINDQDWKSDAGQSFKFPYPSNQAAALKSDLAVALILELSPHRHFGQSYNTMTSPYFYSSTYYSEPTISSPLEYTSHSYIITSDVKSIVLYKKSDRSILLVAPPSKQK